jgi:hypothetical protein
VRSAREEKKTNREISHILISHRKPSASPQTNADGRCRCRGAPVSQSGAVCHTCVVSKLPRLSTPALPQTPGNYTYTATDPRKPQCDPTSHCTVRPGNPRGGTSYDCRRADRHRHDACLANASHKSCPARHMLYMPSCRLSRPQLLRAE